jgi:catechol 2,3-dioxygenase-like lactoylglutathione lyase family enzyme
VSLPARVSFVTLAVRDLPRMAAFFRQFGWPESETNDENHVAFQCGGAILGLYGAERYEPDFGPTPEPGAFKASRSPSTWRTRRQWTRPTRSCVPRTVRRS